MELLTNQFEIKFNKKTLNRAKILYCNGRECLALLLKKMLHLNFPYDLFFSSCLIRC